VLFEMAAEEADESTLDEAHTELDNIKRELASLEVRTLLSGPTTTATRSSRSPGRGRRRQPGLGR